MNSDEHAYVEHFVKAGFGTEGEARTAWESEQAGAASTLPAPPDTDPQLPYEEFLDKKTIAVTMAGFEPPVLSERLFPFQRDIVRWALRRGKGAVFADTGLGKGLIELEFATRVIEKVGGRVLMLAPLAVAKQLVREAEKFGYGGTVGYAQTMNEANEPRSGDMPSGRACASTPIVITNYDRLHLFQDEPWSGVVLDESSILKHHDAKFRTALIEAFESIPYKLAGTATPAPNDHTELGNHAEFLGVMTRAEMLSMFFVHDGGSTQDWKIKGHARAAFWQWVASWAVVVRRPSDVNPDYDDSAFALPPIEYHHHVVPADPNVAKEEGKLFVEPARGLNEQRKARRQSIDGRVKVAADIVKRPRVTPSGQPIGWEEPIGMLAARLSEAGFSGHTLPMMAQWRPPERVKVTAWLDDPSGDMPEILKPLTRKLEPCLVWCDLNQEADEITDAIGEGAEQVAGTDEPDDKERKLFGFIDRKPAVLVTKPKIGGFGLNYQHASRMVFLGVSHSFEAFYQCIRREYRFGQKHKVDIDIVTSELEGEVVANLKRKEAEAAEMAEEMVAHVRETMRRELGAAPKRVEKEYETTTRVGADWTMYLGDCTQVIKHIESDSIDYSIFSPPFASLYTYSDSMRDMGNCKTHDEFYEHFRYLVPELLRVTKPGRLLSFHCMDLPTSKTSDGFIGLTDFRGILVRCFQQAGWILHSQVVIWKDPVTAMQRTKALGLLYKQLKKDSSMSRHGIPDYLVTVRKPGLNAAPIGHTPEEFPVDLWQHYASPVWMDINPNDTLQARSAREHDDERHLCPLQLEVIRRGLKLWTNPGDVVLSPFGGIGSEGYVAIEEGRKYIGIELKRSYHEQACRNLESLSKGTKKQIGLFDEAAP